MRRNVAQNVDGPEADTRLQCSALFGLATGAIPIILMGTKGCNTPVPSCKSNNGTWMFLKQQHSYGEQYIRCSTRAAQGSTVFGSSLMQQHSNGRSYTNTALN
eukprot:1160143-Pelagomonas_calceolata.AAC.7